MCLMPRIWALRMPTVMKSCGTMPRAPLRFLGASSPRYIGTTLDERPTDEEGNRDDIKQPLVVYIQNRLLKIKSPTCAYAHYKPGHNDDLVGLGNLTDSHHHSRDDGEDGVQEKGALPNASLLHIRESCCACVTKCMLDIMCCIKVLYLPSLLTRGATIKEPKKPPRGNMDTESDHNRVRRFPSIGVL